MRTQRKKLEILLPITKQRAMPIGTRPGSRAKKDTAQSPVQHPVNTGLTWLERKALLLLAGLVLLVRFAIAGLPE